MLIEYGIARRKPVMPSPVRLVRPALLTAALCAANLAVADLPASAPFTPAQQQAIRQISASAAQAQVPLVASAAAASVAKTIEGEKQAIGATKEFLELGRKNVDWWLGFLSLLLAVAAFFVWRTNERSRQEWDDLQKGITSEHLQNMKDAAEARKELRQEMQDCIKDAKERFDQHLKLTETSVDILKRDLEQARKMLSEIEQHRDSALAPPADAAPEVIEAAMQTNQSNAAHSPQSKLAAIAQQFGKEKNWQEAASRWQALTDLEPENRGYWFNYSYVLSEWITQSTEFLHIQERAKQADAAWRKSIALQATAEAYYNWGNVLSHWAKALTGEAQQQRFAEANLRFVEAARLKPNDAETYDNWGITLSHWALTLADEAQQQRFAEADQRFAEATRLQPDYAGSYSNWGNSLSDWATVLTGEAQQQRFAEADQRFAEATRLKPDDAGTYSNWGMTLSDWAIVLTGEAQQQRFTEANQRYTEAIRIKPDDASTYYSWGSALADWAAILKGEVQQKRFAEADQCYTEATRLQPDDLDAYYDWGGDLMCWAHTVQGDERIAKLAKAEEVLLKAKRKGHKDPYNLACLRAVQQRPDEARALLEETRAAGFLPDFAHLSTDRDLESLHGLDWFQALLEEVKQQEAASQAAA